MKPKDILKEYYLRCLFHLPHNNIFSFHRVCDDETEKKLTGRGLDTASFRRFVEEHGPYVPLDEICRAGALTGVSALTFDDGLADIYTVVYPFLKAKGIPFTAFILSGRLDTPGYLTTEQLREISKDPLVTIGSHGINHIHFTREDEGVQLSELKKSKADIESITGLPCSIFAYPFGDLNARTCEMVKDSGYEMAFAVEGRPLISMKKGFPYAIPRLSIADTTISLYQRA